MNKLAWTSVLTAMLLGGCASNPPMNTVERVDLERFMGDWYVIANIPTFIEKDAHNALETYALNDDGTVATTFSFRQGSFDGPLKTYHPKGFIKDTDTNALWGMQFVWPVKADYRVVYLDPEYQRTIIGRQARDYVWVMARSPSITEAEYAELEDLVKELGYDTSKLQRVPHQWTTENEDES